MCVTDLSQSRSARSGNGRARPARATSVELSLRVGRRQSSRETRPKTTSTCLCAVPAAAEYARRLGVCRVLGQQWATISHSTVVHHAPAEGDRSLRSPWEWLIVPDRVYGANVTEMHSGTRAGQFAGSQARG